MVFEELEVGMRLSAAGFTAGLDRAESETPQLDRATNNPNASARSAAGGLGEITSDVAGRRLPDAPTTPN